jgi:hypothetical protein
MTLRPQELEFLSAWSREEKAADPYVLPAHQLQAAHGVKGVTLIRLIKAWASSEDRPDEDIFDLYHNPNPPWPWAADQPPAARLAGLASHSQSGAGVGESRR